MMINIQKMMENIKGLQKEVLLEYTASELIASTDPTRKIKAKGLVGNYKFIDQSEADGQARTHWEVPSQTGSGSYEVIVEIHVPTSGGLFTWAKNKKWQPKLFKDVLTKSDVKVHCECGDFKYRMKYNASANGKNAGLLAPNQQSLGGNGKSLTDAPVITNPDGNLKICKHIQRVLTLFPTNASSIMSQAKTYKMSKPADPEKTETVDKGKDPNIENDKVDIIKELEPTQTLTESEKNVVTDSLYKAAEEMSVNTDTPVVTDTIKEDNKEDIEVEDEDADVIDTLNKATELGMIPEPKAELQTQPEITEPEETENPDANIIKTLDYPETEEK